MFPRTRSDSISDRSLRRTRTRRRSSCGSATWILGSDLFLFHSISNPKPCRIPCFLSAPL